MSQITTSELTPMRAEQQRTMTTACTVKRPSRASDGKGGKTVTHSDVVTTVCRINPTGQTPQERAIADRVQGVNTYTLSLPYGTDVTGKDQISADSRTFEVVGVIKHTLETARRVVCVEVG